MKRFFNPCRRYRPDLALLAAGALPDADRAPIENHLAACAACRQHLAELRGTTASLASWAEASPVLEPSASARNRWKQAIRLAASSTQSQPVAAAPRLGNWWQDVIWSSRRVWVGLATVWVFILIGHFSLQDHPRGLAKKSPPPTREVLMAYKEQQTILNELLADRSSPSEAERPKFVPKPRSETVDIRAV